MTIRRLIYFSDRAAGLLGTISSSTVNAAIEKAYGAPAPAQDERLANAIHVGLELTGVIDEYRDMPCDSLRQRMFSTADRYRSRLNPAQTEQQLIGYACQTDLDWEDEPIRVVRDRFRDWQVPVYAPSALCNRAEAEPAPAQDEREAVERFSPTTSVPHCGRASEVEAYMTEDDDGEYMTVAQHERIVAALARPAQTEQQHGGLAAALYHLSDVWRLRADEDKALGLTELSDATRRAARELRNALRAAPIAQSGLRAGQVVAMCEVGHDRLERAALDTKRLEWMIAERCIIESQNGTGSPTVYRVVWPSLGEAQSEWYPTEREAIDNAQGSCHE